MRRVKMLVATAALGMSAILAAPARATADPIVVRHPPARGHLDLVLRDRDGRMLAQGDWTQTIEGDHVVSRLAFRFTDGSLYDEATAYSARQRFELITDHLVEHGPSFPQPIDLLIDMAARRVTVHWTDGRGRPQEDAQHLDLPRDLANGLVPTLLQNVGPLGPDRAGPTVGYVAAMPKPRLVKLAITSTGEERVAIGSTSWMAIHYVLKVEIGGVAGALAPLVGKQPPDSQVWIAAGDTPSFVASEQPLYVGGPLWRIERVAGPP
jgi:hypothetical protein